MAANNGSDWTTVALAALGSSAIGAILGGFLTTWLRGRIERDEDWRTRLIESVDELGAALSELMLHMGRVAGELRRGARPTDDQVEQSVAAWTSAMGKMTRVEILFTHESRTFVNADTLLYLIRDMRRIVEGKMETVDWKVAGLLGWTEESDPTKTALSMYTEAEQRFRDFAAAANNEIRSARLRTRTKVTPVQLWRRPPASTSPSVTESDRT